MTKAVPRPSSFGRRVAQHMGDLLAMKPSGARVDASAVDGDPLPVGVAARLGLLHAVSADAFVLVDMKRGTPQEQAARWRLLRQSAGEAASVDLSQAVTLPIRCARSLHAVQLRDDESVVALRHGDVDMESERVAASLGGQPIPCVREMIRALRPCPRPAADHGPRETPIGAGELLAFVATCRSWMNGGFTLAECALAVERGLTHGDVQTHLDAGLDLPKAAEWAFMPAAEAVRWIAIEFGPADVDTWLSQGRTLAEAEEAACNTGGGRWLARWARVAGRSVRSQALAAWAELGLPVGVWGDIASRGLPADLAMAWLAEGFSSVEILRFAHLRVGLPDALRWREAGFTGFVAAGCLGVGMTLHDACALRGLPMREVQDAWRRSPSVNDVRADVEALVAEDLRRTAGIR